MASIFYTEIFQNITPSSRGVWEEKDISAYLPEGDDITAEIVIANSNSADQNYPVGVRGPGSSLDRKFNIAETRADGGDNCATMHVQVSGGKIELYAPNGVEVFLVGCWVGTKYVETFNLFTPGTTNAWTDKDLSSLGVPSGAIVEHMSMEVWGGLPMGIRSTGSTDDRYMDLPIGDNGDLRYNVWTSFVQTSGPNATIQYYMGSIVVNNRFGILGYWETPPGDYADVFQSDEANPTTNNTWEEVDVGGIPSGAVCSFATIISDNSSSRVLGIRESGSSLERKFDITSSTLFVSTVCMHVNTQSPIETFSEAATDASDDFTLTGYWYNIPSSAEPVTTSGQIDLFVNGKDILSSSGDLFIDGKDSTTSLFDLFIEGHVNSSTSGDLYIAGVDVFFASGDLFVNGKDVSSSSGDLFIHGVKSSVSSSDLFLNGHDTVDSSVSMFTEGHELLAPSGKTIYYEEIFQSIAPSSQNTWEEQDISAYLPAGDDLTVEIVIANSNVAVGSYSVGVRSFGSSVDRRFNLVPALANGGNNCATMHVQVSGGKIELYAPTGVEFFLVGCWVGTKYIETFDFFSPSTLNVWTNKDLSSVGVPSGAIVELMSAQTWGGLLMGSRSVGSTDNRYLKMDIGSDSNQRFTTCTLFTQTSGVNATIQYYMQDFVLNNRFYNIGYWETPPGDYIDVFQEDEANPTTNNTWEEVGVSGVPSGSVCSFALRNSDGTSRVLGIRESGSSLDRKIDLRFSNLFNTYHIPLCIHVNIQSPVETFSEAATGVTDDFTLLGYWDITSTESLNAVDLFILGSPLETLTTSGQIDLFVNGKDILSSSGDLFIDGKDSTTSLFDLFIEGHVNSSTSGDLYIAGVDVFFASGDLFVNGKDVSSSSGDLFIHGVKSSVLSGDLYILGHEDSTESADLYINSHIITSGDISLFMLVSTYVSDQVDLFLKVTDGVIAISGSTVLFVNGFEPRPALVCPVLDPTASIQIKALLIQTYQDLIDDVIDQLGKNVLLEFNPTRDPCPNCLFDAIRNRSTGVYKIGGPRPFVRGRQCPYCKGRGFIETEVTKSIKCLTKWNPEDARTFGISVEQGKDIVRLKTYLTEADSLVRAKTIVVNHDIVGQMKMRVRLIKGPIPVGLREDRYCITFWELI